jgi:hypothetical protein
MNEYKKNFLDITSQERSADTLDNVCSHMANGGDIFNLADEWRVRGGDMIRWLNEEPQKEKYLAALDSRVEWVMQRILAELKRISLVDIRGIFDENGALKNINDWPDDVARAISGVQIDELTEDGVKIGLTKRIKLIDKIRALELQMKNLGMLTEKTMNLHGQADDKKFRDEFFGVGK